VCEGASGEAAPLGRVERRDGIQSGRDLRPGGAISYISMMVPKGFANIEALAQENNWHALVLPLSKADHTVQ
jgi:hypothetical protein